MRPRRSGFGSLRVRGSGDNETAEQVADEEGGERKTKPRGERRRLGLVLRRGILLVGLLLMVSLCLRPLLSLWGVTERGSSSDDLEFLQRQPIDAVYLYVNGSVPGFSDQLNKALEAVEWEYNVVYDRGPLRQRVRDNSELQHSLRSLERYAPWVRTVWLLVPNKSHLPSWLNTSHPRLRVAFHDQVFPNPGADLPSFNSRAIESHIFRLAGLSEYYLYLNDDFFLSAAVTPSDFLKAEEGSGSGHRGTLVYLDEGILATNEFEKYRFNWARGAVEKANRLLNSRYGVKSRAYFRHVPRLMRVSRQRVMHRLWQKELVDTSSHRVRLPWDVHPLFLYFHFLLEEPQQEQQPVAAQKKRVEGSEDAVSEAVPWWKGHLTTKYVSLGDHPLKVAFDLFLVWVWPFFNFVCINDDAPGEKLPKPIELLLHLFLKAMYPQPSSFELRG